jgi:hypothetical protein
MQVVVPSVSLVAALQRAGLTDAFDTSSPTKLSAGSAAPTVGSDQSEVCFTCIRGIIGVRNRLPVIVDLVIVEQHEGWNAAQRAANVLLAQPRLVGQTISIIFPSRIVEPGGGVDIHLVAHEQRKPRLDSCARFEAPDDVAVGVMRNRIIDEPGGVLTRREREARRLSFLHARQAQRAEASQGRWQPRECGSVRFDDDGQVEAMAARQPGSEIRCVAGNAAAASSPGSTTRFESGPVEPERTAFRRLGWISGYAARGAGPHR